ncbi:hypothetical protein BASA81_017372 [Batrachochytrium salamandrivorans]|nr:hypothetical protein BASA81_017372 [Batrachochytrium salamandrivorans]
MVVKLSRDVEFQVDALVTKLNRRVVVGSLPVALETIRLLRTVIGGSRWEDAKALKDTIMEVDARLERAQPIELSVSSISKRVLQLISEEGTALDMEASDMHDDDDEQEDGTFRDNILFFSMYNW